MLRGFKFILQNVGRNEVDLFMSSYIRNSRLCSAQSSSALSSKDCRNTSWLPSQIYLHGFFNLTVQVVLVHIVYLSDSKGSIHLSRSVFSCFRLG